MNEELEKTTAPRDLVLRMTAEIVAHYVGANAVSASAVEDLIDEVYRAVIGLGKSDVSASPPARQKPAVPISRSIEHDHLICLEDGRRLKTLKRYLRTRYNLTPEEYRRKWGLPPDYPTVAPAYRERRSALAKQIGLGRGVRRGS